MIPDKRLILIGAGAAAVGLVVLYYLAKTGRFDPTSPDNLAYQAAGGIVAGVSGGAAAGGEDTVGGVVARFVEWISGTDAEIRAMLEGAPGVNPLSGAIFTDVL